MWVNFSGRFHSSSHLSFLQSLIPDCDFVRERNSYLSRLRKDGKYQTPPVSSNKILPYGAGMGWSRLHHGLALGSTIEWRHIWFITCYADYMSLTPHSLHDCPSQLVSWNLLWPVFIGIWFSHNGFTVKNPFRLCFRPSYLACFWLTPATKIEQWDLEPWRGYILQHTILPLSLRESEILKAEAATANRLHVVASYMEIS